MPDVILQIWKLVLLAFIYLFLFRIVRAIWANLRASTTPPVASAPPQQVAQRKDDNKTISRLRTLEPKDQAGREYELGEEITIGRAPGCKVNIDDTYVSQLHARVFRRDGQVFLEDLGSTNGTFANSKLVSGPLPLRKGDRIQVGRTVLEALR